MMKNKTTLKFISEIPYGESINVVCFFLSKLFLLCKTILKNCHERRRNFPFRKRSLPFLRHLENF